MEKKKESLEERFLRRQRTRKPQPAIVTFTEKLNRWYLEYPARRQVCRTLGLEIHFGHPEIETLYEFSDGEYDHPLLNEVWSRVASGKRYAEGDRDTFILGTLHEEYTVEFRRYCDSNGSYLRAVVTGLDMEYQTLPTGDAACLVMQLFKNDPHEAAAAEAAIREWQEFYSE